LAAVTHRHSAVQAWPAPLTALFQQAVSVFTFDTDHLWTFFGLFGQLLFTSRMIVQWLTSERMKKSVVPVSFWLLSLVGSLILLVYGIRQREIVIIVGQATGCIVYVRNLQLIATERRRAVREATVAAFGDEEIRPAPAAGIPQAANVPTPAAAMLSPSALQ
jgi:lipid-A-disaccharide synthase-like uncharacterized protein